MYVYQTGTWRPCLFPTKAPFEEHEKRENDFYFFLFYLCFKGENDFYFIYSSLVILQLFDLYFKLNEGELDKKKVSVSIHFIKVEGPSASKTDDSLDAMLDPDAIAFEYRQLALQHRSTWSEELVLRPWTEKF